MSAGAEVLAPGVAMELQEMTGMDDAMPGSSDAAMTADRMEHKFLLPRAEAIELVGELNTRMKRHRFAADGALPLPNARHYITTVYFDTPEHVMYRRALASPWSNIKLRAREYYDQHPDLVETATDSSQIYRYHPLLWLELKERSGARTSKQRIGIPKVQVEQFLRGHLRDSQADWESDASADGLELESGEFPDADMRARLIEFIAAEKQPFGVTCVLNYRRAAWQGAEDTVRVTLDSDIAVFRGEADLLTSKGPLVRERLGDAVHVEPGFIAEVKLRGEPPSWLREWLISSGPRAMGGGKFLLACGHLYPEVGPASTVA